MPNIENSRSAKLDAIFGTPLFAVLLAIGCNVLWGSAFPFIKMGYRLFAIETSDTASILCFAGVRFMLGSLLVLAGKPCSWRANSRSRPAAKSWASAAPWACGRPQPSMRSTIWPLPC